MPRPRLFRRIGFRPGTTYFKPAGARLSSLMEVILTLGEFEAIRLKDLENMEEKVAAKKMKISQPTFNRTLKEARKKISDAVVNGKAIRIEGGNFQMVRGSGRGAGRGRGFGGPASRCICPSCHYTVPKQRGIPCNSSICPKCGTRLIRES